MTPLFYAVYHGWRAGQHEAALDDVYLDRILRGKEFFLTKKLGALGTDLSLIANFFEAPWIRPVPILSSAGRAWVINEAGFALVAVGRLADAVEPTRAAAEAYAKAHNWRYAAICYSNLGDLRLTLGDISEAVAAARQSVVFSDRSGDGFQSENHRTDIANALHQSGSLAEAMHLFAEAERLRAAREPEHPILFGLAGYRYCDLLLDQGQITDVVRRSSRTLLIAQQNHWLLDIGLDHLSLGRAYPSGSAEAAQQLNQAADFLRRAGTLHHLPRALLARGTPHDLDEVFRIATRSGMRLHLTDYHLASARLALAGGDSAKAREHIEKAAALIHETGYHRRDAELAKLRAELPA